MVDRVEGGGQTEQCQDANIMSAVSYPNRVIMKVQLGQLSQWNDTGTVDRRAERSAIICVG